jgi:hypothetical protein
MKAIIFIDYISCFPDWTPTFLLCLVALFKSAWAIACADGFRPFAKTKGQ